MRNGKDGTVRGSYRLPGDLVERVRAYGAGLSARADGARVSETEAVRLLLERGLLAAQQEALMGREFGRGG